MRPLRLKKMIEIAWMRSKSIVSACLADGNQAAREYFTMGGARNTRIPARVVMPSRIKLAVADASFQADWRSSLTRYFTKMGIKEETKIPPVMTNTKASEGRLAARKASTSLAVKLRPMRILAAKPANWLKKNASITVPAARATPGVEVLFSLMRKDYTPMKYNAAY